MEKKSSIGAFWGQVKSAWLGKDDISHEDQMPVNRMKQLGNRGAGLTATLEPQDCELIDNIALQKTTVNENNLRWSTNPDKGLRQEVRRAHQMGGVAKGFEIDPLANMVELD